MSINFNIAKQFTDPPGGRYKKNGPKSGEELRDNYLIPALDKLSPKEKLIVDMDGIIGAATSTLEETFGGLIRKRGTDVASKIEIVGEEDPELVEEAKQLMQEQVERQS